MYDAGGLLMFVWFVSLFYYQEKCSHAILYLACMKIVVQLRLLQHVFDVGGTNCRCLTVCNM